MTSSTAARLTDLGMIPNDWRVESLAELGGKVTSGSRGWADYYSDHGDLFVRITNLTRSNIRLDLSRNRYVRVPAGNTEAERTRLAIGDLLVSITADIGIIGYVDETIPQPAYINQHIARVRFSGSVVSSRFVAYYLSSWAPQRAFIGSTDTGAKAGMNLATVGALRTVVPPLPEQIRIAESLTDADHLIAALERTITKKQAIKQGLMQQLLAGSQAIPGSLDWSSKTLIEATTKIMDFRGRTPRKLGMSWGGGAIPALSAGNVRMGWVDFSEECHLGSEALYRRWMTRGPTEVGDVLVTTEAPLGNVAAVPDGHKYILSQRTVLLRPNPELFDKTYFLKYLQSSQFQRTLVENATGSTALGIQRRRLERLTVPQPSLTEQRRIGTALSDVDNEVEVLRHRLAKARAVKQGMMQGLLTGRTRLPVTEAAP